MMAVSVAELKKKACDAIDAVADKLNAVSQEIWKNPELLFQEHHAHGVLTDFLEKQGFPVERNYVVETAFRSVIDHGESPGPTAAVLCEYDALPGIGHACGHNLIAECGIGAAVGIKAAMDAAKEDGQNLGKLHVLGTPAEEGGGGKILMIEEGTFKDVDFAMMCHPAPCTKVNCDQQFICGYQCVVKYHGRASHAAAFPWEGVNALDAAVIAYNNVSVLRQQIKPTWRVHGTITNGGANPSIIPEQAELWYIFRAPTRREAMELKKKINLCFEAAAEATGCVVTVEAHSQLKTGYLNMISNKPLVEAFTTNCGNIGIDLTEDTTRSSMLVAGTDMGNVSYEVPSIHPLFDIGTRAGLHTRDFADAAGGAKAQLHTLAQAKAMAMTTIDMYCQAAKMAAVKEQFSLDMASV